jgi:hypothetical protein
MSDETTHDRVGGVINPQGGREEDAKLSIGDAPGAKSPSSLGPNERWRPYTSGPAPQPPAAPYNHRRLVIRVMIAAIIVGAVIYGLIAGPGSSGPAPVAVEVPRLASTPLGYILYADSHDKFQVAIPAQWSVVDLRAPEVIAAFEHATLSGQPGGSSIDASTQATRMQRVELYAEGPLDKDGNPAIIEVDVIGGGATSDSFSAGLPLAEAYKSGHLTVGSLGFMQLGGKMSTTFTVQVPVSGSGGTVLETKYVIAANDRIYIITTAGTDPDVTTSLTTLSIDE